MSSSLPLGETKLWTLQVTMRNARTGSSSACQPTVILNRGKQWKKSHLWNYLDFCYRMYIYVCTCERGSWWKASSRDLNYNLLLLCPVVPILNPSNFTSAVAFLFNTDNLAGKCRQTKNRVVKGLSRAFISSAYWANRKIQNEKFIQTWIFCILAFVNIINSCLQGLGFFIGGCWGFFCGKLMDTL